MMDRPGGTVVKTPPANAGDMGSIPGSGSSPGEENGNPLQYSCLGNPTDRGDWRAIVHGVAKSQTRLSNEHNTFQKDYLNIQPGLSLVVQWLRVQVPNAGGPDAVSGQGTRSHMLQLKKDPICLN